MQNKRIEVFLVIYLSEKWLLVAPADFEIDATWWMNIIQQAVATSMRDWSVLRTGHGGGDEPRGAGGQPGDHRPLRIQGDYLSKPRVTTLCL